ncbi:hypothetical protein PINS_up002795 [Pythium insidiosum]|nr:hypothetical protein PINS_up002795 [Pythium insidiosum]
MGEQMTEDELRSCLEALLVGLNDEDGAITGDSPTMDSHYTAVSFAEKVLGFDDYEGEQEDAVALRA